MEDLIYRSEIDINSKLTYQINMLKKFTGQRLTSFKEKNNYSKTIGRFDPLNIIITPLQKRVSEFENSQKNKFEQMEVLKRKLIELENEVVENCMILENHNEIF